LESLSQLNSSDAAHKLATTRCEALMDYPLGFNTRFIERDPRKMLGYQGWIV
jgi:hypothetical protein